VRHNSLKEKLRNGETVYGCFIRYPNASLVEVLGTAAGTSLCSTGNTERSSRRLRTDGTCRRTARRHPIVRVPVNQRTSSFGSSTRVLTACMSDGEIGRGCGSRGQVRQVQPRGSRGLAAVRASDYAQRVRFANTWLRRMRKRWCRAHRNRGLRGPVAEILGVEGLDVAFLGRRIFPTPRISESCRTRKSRRRFSARRRRVGLKSRAGLMVPTPKLRVSGGARRALHCRRIRECAQSGVPQLPEIGARVARYRWPGA